MQISDQLIEHLMIAARGIAWDKGVTVSEAEIARQHTRQVLEAALSAAEPVCCGKPVHEGSPEAYTLECCGKFVQSAPSVAVKALQMADETFRDLGWHDKYEATTAALAALSAQVQDVAEPDFSYRIEYDYRSYVEKKTMWGLYRELGVVALEEAQEALRTAQQNNAGNFRISRKPVVKWEPLPAAQAKQEG